MVLPKEETNIHRNENFPPIEFLLTLSLAAVVGSVFRDFGTSKRTANKMHRDTQL